MTKTDKALVILLRIVGVPALFAFVAVVMPTSWMAATHRWLGLPDDEPPHHRVTVLVDQLGQRYWETSNDLHRDGEAAIAV